MRTLGFFIVAVNLGLTSLAYSENNDENIYEKEREFYIICTNKNNLNDYYYPKNNNHDYLLIKGIQKYKKIKYKDNTEKNTIEIKNEDYIKFSRKCKRDYFIQPVKLIQGDDFYFAVKKKNSYIFIDGSMTIMYKNLEQMTTYEYKPDGIRFLH